MARKKPFSSIDGVLFTPDIPVLPQDIAQSGDGCVVLHRDAIVPSPYNEGLSMENVDAYVASIRESGLLEPITVYAKDDGKYEILSGHQRFHAWCVVMGNESIKAVILPYEKDPVKRFKAHTQANTLQRNKDLNFWLTRIDMANRVLDESGFSGKKAERLQEISSMLGGISTMQLYRFEGFKKLIPELQGLESRGFLSANTLYNAIGLDDRQQIAVYEKVKALQDAKVKASRNNDTDYDMEITREEFKKIVLDVKKKGEGSSTEEKAAKTTYMDRVGKSFEALKKTIGKARTKEDRKDALEFINLMRTELDALENELC